MSPSAPDTDSTLRAGRPRASEMISARILAACLLFIVAGGCTDNPFESGEPVNGSMRRVSGSVVLDGQADHSGALLWLEGFGTATVSGSDGRFALLLPPSSLQTTPGGVNGIFNLYAFLGNYRPVAIRTAVRNGTFSFPTESIDETGLVRNPMFMQELFTTETVLSRGSIEEDSPRVITLTVYLRTRTTGTEVFFPRIHNGVEGPIVLHNLETGEARVMKTVVTGVEQSDYIKLGAVPYARMMMLIIPKGTMKAGRYEILPYILPQRQSVPIELLNSITANVSDLGPAYALYPMRRGGGILTVVPN
ncbi:MAG: hypothetical protein M5R41_10740 [Bacteroidia bacterium]|nr:hypothetical protein [Bacteroidia bacterium]